MRNNRFALEQRPTLWTERLPRPVGGLWNLTRGLTGTGLLLWGFVPLLVLLAGVDVLRAWRVARRRRSAGLPVAIHGGRGFWSKAHFGHITRIGISERCLAQLLVPEAQRGWLWRQRQRLTEVATVLLYIPYAKHPIALFDELRTVYGGSWFPFGDGVTVASHGDVAAWLAREDIFKRGQSLGWPSSDSQVGYSAMSPIFLSSAHGTPDREVWGKAKHLVIRWLASAWSATATDGQPAGEVLTRQPWLPALLRLVPRHSTGVPDRDAVWRAYGETQFYLLTHGGELSRDERRAYLDLVANPAPFFSNFMNFLVGGAALERKGIRSFEAVRAALYRERDCAPLASVLGDAERIGVSPNELLKLFSIIVGIAGGPAPPKLAHSVILRLYSDPAAMVPLWRQNPRRFVLECARLDKLVPIISINSADRFTVRLPRPALFDAGDGPEREVQMDERVPIRLCYATANHDPAVFADPFRFDPQRPNLYDLVSWNSPAASALYATTSQDATDSQPGAAAAAAGCPHAKAAAAPRCPVTGAAARADADSTALPAMPVAFAPRYCAGRDWALDLIEFVVERFLPAAPAAEPEANPLSEQGILNRPLCASFDYPTAQFIPLMSSGPDTTLQHKQALASRTQPLLDGLDSYTRAVMKLMKLAVPKWNAFVPRGIDVLPPAEMDLWASTTQKPVPIRRIQTALRDRPERAVRPGLTKRAGARPPGMEIALGLGVPSWDEDVPQGFPLARRIVRTVVNSGVVSGKELYGNYFPFPGVDVALTWKRALFAAGLPAGRQAMEEVHSDAVMTQLAFAGPSCHLTKRLPTREQDGDDGVGRLARLHAPEEAVFVHDVSELSRFPVRKPYERYGAVAYFDAAYRPLGIWWCHGARYVPASDATTEAQAAWHYAKYVWRTSWFVHVTVVDHLTSCHLVVANALTVACRVQLPAAHPLRVFLKPYTFHTVSINFQASRSLVNPGGLFHRIWAFDHPTLEQIVAHVTHTRLRGGPGGWAVDHDLASWKRNTVHRSMHDVPDEVFPLRRDLEAFWAVVSAHVDSFLRLHYAPELAADQPSPRALPLPDVEPELHAFLVALSDALGVPFEGAWREALDLLTHAIVTVSAWHMHTGILVDYVQRPDWIGCKLQGKATENVQTWTQLLALMCVAGIKMPGMLDDFSHLWPEPDDPHHAASRGLAARFRSQLQLLDSQIAVRNSQRRYPLWTIAPQYMDCSVGS